MNIQCNYVTPSCARLHPRNVLGIRQFGETFSCLTLVDACNRYLQKHFVQVSEADEFLCLNFEEVKDIISRDELNVPAESNVSSHCCMLLVIFYYIRTFDLFF